MADLELQTVLNSGAVNNIFLTGTNTQDKVLRQEEVDAKVDPVSTKADDNETNIAALVAGETSLTKSLFTPQAVAPTYVESTVYYNDNTGTLDVQGGYSDVTLQVGREMHAEVVNNTGVLIPNGTAVRHNGATAGQIQVAPALADTYTTSRVVGVATHDIADGATGIITTFGLVGGVDTLGLDEGTPIYLSDTVPGGLTSVAPDVASQVGGCTISNADGEIFILLENNTELPTIYGSLRGGSLPATITGSTAYDLDTFSTTSDVLMPTNTAAGTISCPATGSYRLTVNLSMSFDAVGNQEVPLTLTLRSTDGAESTDIINTIPRNSSVAAWYPSPIVTLTAGKDYQVRVTSSSTLTGVSASFATFDLQSVFIR